MRGTPKTLNGAIQNAFEEYKKEKVTSEARLRKLVKLHVQDWIRQNVGVIVLESDLGPQSEKAVTRLTKR